ncbi:phosphotransferase [Armatimonas sp.]|uniref:phosphotransferase n=1 Tax=Armatimonas sp. TaxID=1872638 RepID=UPI00374FE6B8
MIVTCFGQESQSQRWWKLVGAGAESVRELPLHRRFMPHATKDEATLIAEGARPDEALWIDEADLPVAVHEPHLLRVPWGYAGWLEVALAWIAEHADGLRSWKEVKSWSLSCVIRAETGRGVVYFKATNQQPALFANEADVTQNLAERFAGLAPLPLATDPERGWMLLQDFGPSLRETHGDSSAALALTDYSRFQQTTLGQEAALLKLGCVDRRPAHFARELPKLLADEICLSPLTDDERERLLSVDWQAKIAAFSDSPCALVHGDLHMGNVAQGPNKDGSLLYFDWTDASVGLPWLDILTALWEDTDEASRKLYAAWSTPLPPWETIVPLTALHHAISYRHIYHALEPCVQHEHKGGVKFFLRKASEFS